MNYREPNSIYKKESHQMILITKISKSDFMILIILIENFYEQFKLKN
jgi:hypothetical protein